MSKIPRVSAILETASKQKGRLGKSAYLRTHRPNQTMLLLFQIAFDPAFAYDLPKGDPPYTPADGDVSMDSALYREARKLKIFTSATNINKIRKEQLFIQLLESIHPEDAKLLCAVKDGKIPYKGITEKVVRDAFPTLLPNKEVK